MVDICQEGRSEISSPEETRHTRETKQPGPGWWLRHMAHLGQCTRQAPGHLSCSDLERAQNARPTKSVPLQSTREPEPEQLTPGKCTKCRAHFGQHPCRATWSLSNVDWESTHAVSRGKPSVVLTLRALPTHASDICLQCSSLATAQQKKLA